MPDFKTLKKIYSEIYDGILQCNILAVKTSKDEVVAAALEQMAFGNSLRTSIEKDEDLFNPYL